jgi:hypothetical protein
MLDYWKIYIPDKNYMEKILQDPKIEKSYLS